MRIRAHYLSAYEMAVTFSVVESRTGPAGRPKGPANGASARQATLQFRVRYDPDIYWSAPLRRLSGADIHLHCRPELNYLTGFCCALDMVYGHWMGFPALRLDMFVPRARKRAVKVRPVTRHKNGTCSALLQNHPASLWYKKSPLISCGGIS